MQRQLRVISIIDLLAGLNKPKIIVNQTCGLFYYNNKEGGCSFVSPLCRKFNQRMGVCQVCFSGYQLFNGFCAQIKSKNSSGVVSGRNKIINCTGKSILLKFINNCVQVDNNCNIWDGIGNCIQCYTGYILSQGNCVEDKQIQKCQQNYVLVPDKSCKKIVSFCNTFDVFTGSCLLCIPGFNMTLNRTCKIVVSPLSIYCKVWQWDANFCKVCLTNYILNKHGICVPVADYCNEADQFGWCVSCLCGYELMNGSCVISESNGLTFGNLGCKAYEWKGGKCLQCEYGYYLDKNDWCIRANFLCKQSSRNTGKCVSCFQGYNLINGDCVSVNRIQPGCKIWSSQYGMCVFCQLFWVYSEELGKCVPISDACIQIDEKQGLCQKCYQGYVLVNGSCLIRQMRRINMYIYGCMNYSSDNLSCVVCAQRYRIDLNGACHPVSQFCLVSDVFGVCLLCYQGFILRQGMCDPVSTSTIMDPGCRSWNWKEMSCSQCSFRYVLAESQSNMSNYCIKVNDLCASWDNFTAYCKSCYRGYFLYMGECIMQKQTNCKTWNVRGMCGSCYPGFNLFKGKCNIIMDLNCAFWSMQTSECLKCANRYVLSTNATDVKKFCLKVSDLCERWNDLGECTSCYKGYVLAKHECVLGRQIDAYCLQFDNFGSCLKCSLRFYIDKGRCSRVDDLCQTWDNLNGSCLSCFKGYSLKQGKCVISTNTNLYCANMNQTQSKCTRCYSGYFISDGQCKLVDPLCRSSASSGECTSCYMGYKLVGGKCVV